MKTHPRAFCSRVLFYLDHQILLNYLEDMARVTSRLSKSTLVKIMVTVFIVVIIDDIPFFYRWLTDDGHGIYLPPDRVDPPPELDKPWPPIAPPEGPLPRLSRSDIPTYFFPQDAEQGENGFRTRRFELDVLPVNGRSPRILNDPTGLAERQIIAMLDIMRAHVPEIPPAYVAWERESPLYEEDVRSAIGAFVARKHYKRNHREDLFWRNDGPLGQRMFEIGCSAVPSLRLRRDDPPEQQFSLERVNIATWHNVGEPTVDHCLFKALLVALGLHPTEGFFFKEGPVTPEEQARALAALALLYHPAVKPGMTEDEFVAVLLENDLIDP